MKPSPPSVSENDPARLAVFDHLAVGPVTLEPNRITAPYRLSWNGREEQTLLRCRYETPLFHPPDATGRNLADMIAVQVALNYGLFCRRITFHGGFDHLDRRFIRTIVENTAREIYVKKFLEPNIFLQGEAAHLAPFKKSIYSNATLEFTSREDEPGWRLWETDRARHLILSSGGKDSLLSHGLLSEIGKTVYPAFVNESGRHWFTALNAYRYFRDQVKNTQRVWVDSDRLFSWMLQRLPFVRKNYAAVRSDAYPIRLWTVAVFLFGALPLMRRHRIGRLIIGDEFDTSVKKTLQGIPHYEGLYDQSVWFDRAMSRYFMQKGWNVSIFSILRPLSELLIEKTLAERYPHLLRLQMSCHAAHKEDDHIHPCGKCEKCRRIVSMLSALDIDPGRCGYNERQIRHCLDAFGKAGAHQEAAGVQHVGYMLQQKGLLPCDRNARSKPHPEILKLRFDPIKSPLDGIPENIRRPLIECCLPHADGALKRSGRAWIDFNPLEDPAIRRPFPFEAAAPATPTTLSRDVSDTDRSSLWGELNWPEIRERLARIDIALLPVGSIEQHGPHLPLDTDAFDADLLAKRVAMACSDPRPLVLPLLPYGVSYHHDAFPGTISVSNDTLANLVYDIGMSAARNGIQKLVIINGHGGNSPALNFAAQLINRDARIFTCVDTGETSDVDIAPLIETPNDVHAGEAETSTTLAVRPRRVKKNAMAPSIPAFSSHYLNFTSRRGVSWYAATDRISTSGVMGDPTKASRQKGKKIWEIMIAHLVALVEDIKQMSLDEIHHGRPQ